MHLWPHGSMIDVASESNRDAVTSDRRKLLGASYTVGSYVAAARSHTCRHALLGPDEVGGMAAPMQRRNFDALLGVMLSCIWRTRRRDAIGNRSGARPYRRVNCTYVLLLWWWIHYLHRYIRTSIIYRHVASARIVNQTIFYLSCIHSFNLINHLLF